MNFGHQIVTTRYSDDVLLRNRQYSWQWSAGIQHELLPRVALNVGYFRTSWQNHRVTDNLGDHAGRLRSVLRHGAGRSGAAERRRRPAVRASTTSAGQVRSGGQPDRAGDRFRRANRGVQRHRRDGQRTVAGAQLGGGLSTGRTGDNDCVLIDTPQAIRSGYCNVDTPLSSNTQVKLNGSYVLPYDFQVSAAFQNIPGIPIAASYVASNAEVRPIFGRNLSGSAANVIVDLIPPGTMYEPASLSWTHA